MYIVIEIQKTADDNLATLINTYTSTNEAESKYHQILTAAALSNVFKHGAVLLTEDGYLLRNESYTHN